MLPKVHSLSSLSGAVRSVAQRSSQATTRDSSNGRRRSSMDTPSRSRSRPGSCVDLVSLELDSGTAPGALSITIPGRPNTPPPPSLWPLIESPISSFTANDALARMAILSASLEASRDATAGAQPAWKTAGPAASLPEIPLQSVAAAAKPEPAAHVSAVPAPSPVKVAVPAKVPEPVTSLASTDTPAAISVAVAESVPVAAAEAPAPVEIKAKRKSKRVGPAARPGPDEVRIYRSTMAMDYVQELLGNLTHVQRMFRGVAGAGGPSSTAAAAAAAAARLLSRSFSRAASRVRESVKDPNAVHLSEDALVTLAEFGWVEVSTEDPEQAKLMGCVEAEVHHLPSGRVASYQRPAVDKAWWQVGDALPAPTANPYATFPSSPRSTLDGLDSGNSSPTVSSSGVPTAMPRTINAYGVKMDVAARPAFAAGASVAGRGGLMTIAGLADHLQTVSQSVQSAAQHLNQWLEEHKASLLAPVAPNPNNTSSQPATTVVGFSPAAAVGAI